MDILLDEFSPFTFIVMPNELFFFKYMHFLHYSLLSFHWPSISGDDTL